MIIKLRRFKKYLAQIESLKEQNSNLKSQIEELSYYHEESISRIERRNRTYQNEIAERERQAESDRWYRESELRKATSDLERAVSYNDDYAIKRATDKLKRLS